MSLCTVTASDAASTASTVGAATDIARCSLGVLLRRHMARSGRDRRWEVWHAAAMGTGLLQSGAIVFIVDGKLSYPQLIVYALEMRRRMGVNVPKGIMALLKTARDIPTRKGFEEMRVAWVTE